MKLKLAPSAPSRVAVQVVLRFITSNCPDAKAVKRSALVTGTISMASESPNMAAASTRHMSMSKPTYSPSSFNSANPGRSSREPHITWPRSSTACKVPPSCAGTTVTVSSGSGAAGASVLAAVASGAAGASPTSSSLPHDAAINDKASTNPSMDSKRQVVFGMNLLLSPRSRKRPSHRFGHRRATSLQKFKVLNPVAAGSAGNKVASGCSFCLCKRC